jgi:polyferredoxin
MSDRQKALKRDRWQRLGEWLLHHQPGIRRAQWTVVVIYLVLLVAPVLLPLPGRTAYIWNNVTRFAQFAFWGIWWPFVLLATMLVGRMWCGLLCPEGSLSEFASRHGRAGAIPRLMQWPGWPTVAFVTTTLYGQMTSVYQYPGPALLVLGGSTLAAMLVGYLYGRNKRVWCRYLCPVSGVFALLAKLAPLHFRVDADVWRLSQLGREKPAAVNCAPLVPLRTMRGGSACHMCGRCSGFRGAIRLARRSPNHEIVHVAGDTAKPWETVLIVFGLMGIALGAFQWTASPWFIAAKQFCAERLPDAGWRWPVETRAPWWILTNYPERNDVLTLLDGALLVGYISAAGITVGAVVAACLAAATRCLGPWRSAHFHHLAQALIPLAAAGVFLGLSTLTVGQLAMDGLTIPLVRELRALILLSATLWTILLFWKVSGRYASGLTRRIPATLLMAPALALVDCGWFLLFWGW